MKKTLLKAAALTVDVGGPLIATLTQFPIWIERSAGATVSGLVVFFAIVSALPVAKHFGSALKTPSIPLVWGLIFCGLLALSAIITEMIVISFVGLVSNAIGWGLFKLAGTEEKTSDRK